MHRHQPAGPVGVVLDQFTETVDIDIQLNLATFALFSPDVIHQVLVGDTITKVISQVKKDPELGPGKSDLQTVLDQHLFVRVQEAIVPKRYNGFFGDNHNNRLSRLLSRNFAYMIAEPVRRKRPSDKVSRRPAGYDNGKFRRYKKCSLSISIFLRRTLFFV
jgi:hypothetical protein